MFILIVLWSRPKTVKYHKPTVSTISSSMGSFICNSSYRWLIISVVEAELFLFLLKID